MRTYIHIQIYKHTDIQKARQPDRQTDRQADVDR